MPFLWRSSFALGLCESDFKMMSHSPWPNARGHKPINPLITVSSDHFHSSSPIRSFFYFYDISLPRIRMNRHTHAVTSLLYCVAWAQENKSDEKRPRFRGAKKSDQGEGARKISEPHHAAAAS